MNNDLVLSSRQAPTLAENLTPAPPPPANTADGALLPTMENAHALASAGPTMLPKHYDGNVGACLMLLDYCNRMNIGPFEAIAEVSFNRGRATVGARLQRKFASRVGYITRRIEGDAESCTVAVVGPDGREVGRSTYTYQQAKDLGIIYLNGRGGALKQTWAGDPAQMLFHRATTRALDHYGPSELSTAFAEEAPSGPPASDLVEIVNAGEALPAPEESRDDPEGQTPITADESIAPDGLPHQPEFHVTAEEEAQADQTETPVTTVDDLKTAARKVGLLQVDLIKAAGEMYPKARLTSLQRIAENREAAYDVLMWAGQQGSE